MKVKIKRMFLISTMVVMSFGIHSSIAQKYDYLKRYDEVSVLSEYRTYYDQALKSRNEIRSRYFSTAKNAEEYLPKNFSKKGDVDYTAFLQKALDENQELVLPDFPVMISPEGLEIRSNSKIYFPEKSKLIIKPNNLEIYAGLMIENVHNVEVYFPSLIGDKKNHKGNTGQWGNGIWLKNSKDIFIYAPYVIEFWGDGISIGSRSEKTNENILIQNGLIDNNRRNGLSIISGRNIQVKNMSLGNTIGQNPQSGIDVEPFNNKHVLKEINLENIVTYNNPWHGIIISTGDLVGKRSKNITVNIQNHTDYGSHIGLGLSFSRNNKDGDYMRVKGMINVENVLYKNNRFFIRTYNQKKSGIKVKVKNVSLNKFGEKLPIKLNLNRFLNSVYDSHQSIE